MQSRWRIRLRGLGLCDYEFEFHLLVYFTSPRPVPSMLATLVRIFYGAKTPQTPRESGGYGLKRMSRPIFSFIFLRWPFIRMSCLCHKLTTRRYSEINESEVGAPAFVV